MTNQKDLIDLKIEYNICSKIGKLYILANEMGFDIKDFSKSFLKSNFCHRAFDTIYSFFQNEDEDVSMEYLLKEITPLKAVNDIPEDVIYWIGFMYRYIYIHTGISSNKICDIVSFDEMLKYIERTMYPFEEYSEDEVFEIIDKDKNFNQYK